MHVCTWNIKQRHTHTHTHTHRNTLENRSHCAKKSERAERDSQNAELSHRNQKLFLLFLFLVKHNWTAFVFDMVCAREWESHTGESERKTECERSGGRRNLCPKLRKVRSRNEKTRVTSREQYIYFLRIDRCFLFSHSFFFFFFYFLFFLQTHRVKKARSSY